ncbi:MAG: cell envelope integrity protein TolA [Arsenophonus sp. NC-TX2-MAG3]
MRKTKEEKNKLSRSVVLSIILHVLLFSFIIWSSLDQVIKLSGEVIDIDAIMVDPGAVIEQYTQLKQQQNSSKQVNTEEKKRLQQQEEEFRKQKEEEQKRFKMIEEERIKIERETEQQHRQKEEIAKQAKEQKKRAEEASDKAKAKQELLIKEQTKAKARAKEKVKKESEIAKAEAQTELKEKAENAAKALIADKKKTADVVKQTTSAYSLLGGLTAKQPSKKMGTSETAEVENRKSGVSSSDVDNYAGKIKAAIERKFYNSDIYRGKTCELNIKLAPDGMLISVFPKSNTENDQSLCNAAIRVIKTTIMPKPPNRSIYNEFNEQGSALIFKP